MRESSEQSLTWTLHRASPGLDCLHAVPPPLHWFGFWLQGINNPTMRLGPSNHPETLCGLPLGVSRLDHALGHKLHTMTEHLHALSAHGPRFPGTLDLMGCSPSSRFTKFVTPDRFGIADASLSHFVSHVDIVRSLCRHVWRNLRGNHPWYLFSRIGSAQFTKWAQFFFF